MDTRCSVCPGIHRCVDPSGPEHNDIGTFIGEAPGIEEDKRNEPFSGKTGRECRDHYAPLASIRWPSIRVTNAIRCLPDRPKHKLDLKRQADRDLLQACTEHHLYPEINRSKPTLLVPMGAFACKAIDSGINLELHHGIPLETDWGTTFPMYHPAGGLHEPKKMLQIRTDWYRLRQYLGGQLALPVDQYPCPDYKECETEEELDAYFVENWSEVWATDTEVSRQRVPYCVSFSIKAGTARVIRSTNRPVLRKLDYWITQWRGRFLFHNWLFDGEVVEALGLNFPWDQVVDTMVKVFHLGNLPQGLKALSYRELGMEMQDFDDLVTPFSKPIVLDYYRNAMCEEWTVPPEQLVRESSGGWKLYKPQGFRTKLKRFWTAFATNEDIDVYNTWYNNWEEHHSEVDSAQGPFPGKCISQVPWDKVVYYSARDADATIRLWPVIKAMEEKVGKCSQERWRS